MEITTFRRSKKSCLWPIQIDSPDVQLIQRFQEGDSKVFNLLYRRYHDRIYGVICSMISNREDALDISQDVFLQAYQALGNFKGVSQFYSWLYRIAINCCIDFMRRGAKHRVLTNNPGPMMGSIVMKLHGTCCLPLRQWN